MKLSIKVILEELFPKIVEIRRHIHQHPELAYEEVATASTISNALKDFGLDAATVSKTGVYAVLDSGKPGKTVALRAELDALPIQEETNLPYESKNTGKMHACGHDGHIATLIAVAGALTQCKDSFKGKIKFIFQPAEETGTGAIEIIKNGILEHPKVDAIFGCHSTHRYEALTLATKFGCLMAGHDTFTISIQGQSGYVSSSHLACDPIYIGSLIVQALQNIQSRATSPLEPTIIAITQFHSGNSYNFIPDEVLLNGSIRTILSTTQTQIKQQVTKIATEIATAFGAKAIVKFEHGIPPMLNSQEETELVIKTAQHILGKENVMSTMNTVMAPEGFSNYLEYIPGCFFFIGNGLEQGMLHKSNYKFNDEIISVTAEILSNVAVNYLNSH